MDRTSRLTHRLVLVVALLAAMLLAAYASVGLLVGWYVGAFPWVSLGLAVVSAGALGYGLYRRHALALVGVAPSAWLFTVAELPDAARSSLFEPGRAAVWVLALVVYGAAVLRWTDVDAPLTPDVDDTLPMRGSWLDGVLLSRAVTALALLAVPLAVIESGWLPLAEPPSEGVRVFTHLFVVFLWSVGVYLLLIAPSFAPHHDASAQASALRSAPGGGLRRVLGAAGWATAALLALAWMLPNLTGGAA